MRIRTSAVRFVLAAAALALAVAGCGDDSPPTPVEPVKLTRDHRGHYCRMIVLDHKGPKGQIHLKTGKIVVFSSVRDTIAFTLLPEEPKNIAAIFVNDMSATDWDRPGPDTWIKADKAFYVIGSEKRGGMGASEAVPFAARKAAAVFAGKFGGEIARLGEIPRDYILGESGTGNEMKGGNMKGGDMKGGHEQ